MLKVCALNYQNQYQQKINSIKDEKIDRLINQNNNLINQNNNLQSTVDEVVNQNNNLSNQNQEFF